jgi:para-aminobenzoate synthetase component 1
VIELAAPPLAPAEAARRAARLPAASWIASPRDDAGEGELEVRRDYVAAAPVEVVSGRDVGRVEDAWARARARWGTDVPGVPVASGWLSYDLAGALMRFGDRDRPPSGWSDLELRFHDAVWVSDERGARVLAAGEPAGRALLATLAQATAPSAPDLALGPLREEEPAERHLGAVARVIEYLHAGDVYQVNLARRLSATIRSAGDPVGWALAARLRRDAPAPHAAWLVAADGSGALVGNSPERLLRLDGHGGVETRPIKGTRPRGADAADDARLARELLASPKDRAEHAMIVDLERNDLGRVCRTGSVLVEDWGRLVSLPTVHHLVSTVRGGLRPEVGLMDLLRATFPGGSITGAPKRRAMEIIAELEPARRGPYTGATGWLGAAGDADLAVAIRTAFVQGNTLQLWVGGGIVVSSDPAAELAETWAKARAFAALAGAKNPG